MAWWDGREQERIWVELTFREDVGADLKAPNEANQTGSNWRYDLFRLAKPGDLVLHYQTGTEGGFIGHSTVEGLPVDQPIVWRARGSSARQRGEVDELHPGYKVPLANYQTLSPKVSLADLRAKRDAILAMRTKLEALGGRTYLPFALGDTLQPAQGYAFVLPIDFLDLFPQLDGLKLGRTIDEEGTAEGVAEPRRRYASHIRQSGQPGPHPSEWSAQTAHLDGVTATYLLRFGDTDVWKIGISQNPSSRCSALNFSIPTEILEGRCWEVMDVHWWPSGAPAYKMEQMVLSLLERSRTANERVQLPEQEVKTAWELCYEECRGQTP